MQGGIPFWLGCTILLQQLVSGASLMAASGAAVMAGLTALLAHFMPQVYVYMYIYYMHACIHSFIIRINIHVYICCHLCTLHAAGVQIYV
jgi:hypothetical protein